MKSFSSPIIFKYVYLLHCNHKTPINHPFRRDPSFSSQLHSITHMEPHQKTLLWDSSFPSCHHSFTSKFYLQGISSFGTPSRHHSITHDYNLSYKNHSLWDPSCHHSITWNHNLSYKNPLLWDPVSLSFHHTQPLWQKLTPAPWRHHKQQVASQRAF